MFNSGDIPFCELSNHPVYQNIQTLHYCVYVGFSNVPLLMADRQGDVSPVDD